MPDVAPRLMPKRDFFGNTANMMLAGITAPVATAMRPLAEGERKLGMFILPSFQREQVWTLDQQQRLIRSIYKGRPIGALIWNQTSFGEKTDGWLLDGQQRMTAILNYVLGDFTFEGWRFLDLPEIEQKHFLRISIAIVETNIRDEAECRDLYNDLVFGGTAHDPAARA